MLLINMFARYTWYHGLDTDSVELVDRGFYISEIVEGTAVIEVITGRCREDTLKSNRRTYFDCNKLQIYVSDLLYGKNND